MKLMLLTQMKAFVEHQLFIPQSYLDFSDSFVWVIFIFLIDKIREFAFRFQKCSTTFLVKIYDVHEKCCLVYLYSDLDCCDYHEKMNLRSFSLKRYLRILMDRWLNLFVDFFQQFFFYRLFGDNMPPTFYVKYTLFWLSLRLSIQKYKSQ